MRTATAAGRSSSTTCTASSASTGHASPRRAAPRWATPISASPAMRPRRASRISSNRLATLDNGSGLQLPASGNPFPIAGAGQASSSWCGQWRRLGDRGPQRSLHGQWRLRGRHHDAGLVILVGDRADRAQCDGHRALLAHWRSLLWPLPRCCGRGVIHISPCPAEEGLGTGQRPL